MIKQTIEKVKNHQLKQQVSENGSYIKVPSEEDLLKVDLSDIRNIINKLVHLQAFQTF